MSRIQLYVWIFRSVKGGRKILKLKCNFGELVILIRSSAASRIKPAGFSFRVQRQQQPWRRGYDIVDFAFIPATHSPHVIFKRTSTASPNCIDYFEKARWKAHRSYRARGLELFLSARGALFPPVFPPNTLIIIVGRTRWRVLPIDYCVDLIIASAYFRHARTTHREAARRAKQTECYFRRQIKWQGGRQAVLSLFESSAAHDAPVRRRRPLKFSSADRQDSPFRRGADWRPERSRCHGWRW